MKVTVAKEMLTRFNTFANEVSRVKDIPCDYYGVMGVPITFESMRNKEQFELLGMLRPKIDNHALYTRLLVRRMLSKEQVLALKIWRDCYDEIGDAQKIEVEIKD